MALETQDDYQDKIDDLMKEVEKLYDEGTDKGFKLKREEQMDQELRALETEKDYQKEYDRLWDKEYNPIIKQMSKVNNKLKSLKKEYDNDYSLYSKSNEYKKINAEIEKLNLQSDKIAKKMGDIADEAKKKGFKIKLARSEASDFEARKNEILKENNMNLEERKQEILANLEVRALETEKDYQREYDNLVAVVIKLKKKAQENKEEWLRLKKEEEANLKWAAVYIKDCDKLVAEAKKKGFKIKEKSY